MKKISILFLIFTVIFTVTACTQKNKTDETIDSQTAYDTTETTLSTANSSRAPSKTSKYICYLPYATDKNEETKSNALTTSDSTTITDTFIITKVSGTYLELQKIIYGTNGRDIEKSLYCCDYGEMDGSADMHYNVGEEITIKYDREVAETYPAQLTVREILTVPGNNF